MIKLLKITGIILAGLVVLAVVLLVIAKLFISPERIRKTVVPLAEKSLNRRVAVGDIQIRLFSGISLQDLRVQMRDGDETFISADALLLRYQLWPLLKKQVVIDEVRLEKPEIRVIRNVDGSFNFSDLLQKREDTRTAGSPALAQTSGGPAVDLLVSRVQIRRGRLTFIDRAVGKEPVEYRAEGLKGSASDISLEKAFPFDMAARLNDADLSASGTLNPATSQIKAEARVNDIRVSEFAPYFRNRIPGRLSSASLSLEASVSGDGQHLESAGSIRARGIDLVLDALPDAPLRGAQCRLDYDLSADMSAQQIQIRRADLDLNGIPLSAAGQVTQFKSTPGLDLALQMPETRVQQILPAVPENLAAEAARMKPGGAIGFDLEIAGRADTPETMIKSGSIRLNQLSADAGGLRSGIDGVVNLSTDRIFSKDLQVKLGADTVSVDLEVTGFYSTPVHITHRIHAAHLDLDALIAAAGQGRDTGQTKPEKQAGKEKRGAAEKEIGPLDLPLRVNGHLTADRARYRDLPITDVRIHYTLVDNVLTVDEMSAQMAGGKATGNARVDLAQKGLNYDANLDLAGIQSGPVISAFHRPAGSVFSGIANIQTRLTGSGVRMADIRQNLNSDTEFLFSDGKIASPALAGGLADTLGIRRLENLDFDVFKGNFRLESGKIRISGDYDSKDVKMQPTGTIGLDGRLNLDLNLRLAPDLSSKLPANSPVARLLADKQGWTQVPLSVSGAVSGPRFVLDRSRLQDQIRQKATEKVLDKALQKLFE